MVFKFCDERAEVRAESFIPIEISGRGVLIEERFPRKVVGGGIVLEPCESFTGGKVDTLVKDDSGEIYAASVNCCWRFRGGAVTSSVASWFTAAIKLELNCKSRGATALSSSRQSAFSWIQRCSKPKALIAVRSGSIKSSLPE
jgi:hypothetical protein